MSITKPTVGATGWDTATDAVIDWVNAVAPNTTLADVQEVARDAVGTALTAGTNITISVNDGANTITVSGLADSNLQEIARDAVGAALVAGTGLSISVNDAGDTITITNTGGGGGGSYTFVAGINTEIDEVGSTVTIGDYELPDVEVAVGSNVTIAQGSGTSNTWTDMTGTPANVSITNPHPTKDMLVMITAAAWLITNTNGSDVRFGYRTTGDISGAAGPSGTAVAAPSWGHVPFNGNGGGVTHPASGPTVSFASTYSGVIPAAGTVDFIAQYLISNSASGTKAVNYSCIQITPMRYLP